MIDGCVLYKGVDGAWRTLRNTAGYVHLNHAHVPSGKKERCPSSQAGAAGCAQIRQLEIDARLM